MKKVLLLFLALMLPGLIFVFLKYAGKNEFTIPVYHEAGVMTAPSDCGQTYPTPYHIADSVRKVLGMSSVANVLVFPDKSIEFKKISEGIKDEFQKDAISVQEAAVLINDTAKTERLKKCVFLVNTPSQSVLMDEAGRIRGYYDLSDREEIDRLRVEMKILLNKY